MLKSVYLDNVYGEVEQIVESMVWIWSLGQNFSYGKRSFEAINVWMASEPLGTNAISHR